MFIAIFFSKLEIARIKKMKLGRDDGRITHSAKNFAKPVPAFRGCLLTDSQLREELENALPKSLSTKAENTPRQ